MKRAAAAGQLPLYAVRRSTRARRARLTVTDAGEALVVLPAWAPSSMAAELVARHAGWVERHQRRIGAEQAALVARPPLDAGRLLPLRGEPVRVTVERLPAGRRSTVSLEAGAPPLLVVRRAMDARESVAVLLERWLRAQARHDIGAVIARRAPAMGLEVGRISIRDQRTRWGSASAHGALSFSWRLVLCPPAVLDYVVVHELAHLRWRGHGRRFWGLVERHVPRADEHRRWLDEQHRALHAALD
ncbi:MAG TPA: SprT family zinc-dependent metalloprotease [Candidatus Limnocylindrales bacterium]|jgi:predicted metal-dependent hydrolase